MYHLLEIYFHTFNFTDELFITVINIDLCI